MLKKIQFLSLILFFYGTLAFSQSGTLKGTITDKQTKEAIPFASIVIESGGKQYGGTTSDIDGNYTIKPIPPGKYDIKATFVGYSTFLMKNVVMITDKITFQNIELTTSIKQLDAVEVYDYKVPLIEKDGGASGATITSEEIAKMPGRSAAAVAATVGGVSTDENGSILGIRGQRSSGTVMYIDGVRVRGSSSLPQSAIEQVTVITGGLPAQYGDATGGVINVITKGPSRNFGFGLQYETSELFDHQHYNMLDFSVQGPLLLGKDSTKSTSLLGFFISGELYTTKAGKSSLPEYTVNADLKKQLEDKPLRPSGTGYGNFLSSEFITKSDLVEIKDKDYSRSQGFNISGKIDVRTTQTTNLTFGGTMVYGDGLGWNRANSLLNSENNGKSSSYTWRAYGRFSQRFLTDKESNSLIKNIYYSIQADYTFLKSKSEDAEHKDNLFSYGYLGKFSTYKKRSYEYGYDSVAKLYGYLHNNTPDTLITFEQADINIKTGNYTKQYYDMYSLNSGYFMNKDLIQYNRALLNGESPSSVYGLWSNTGSRVGSYGVNSQAQIGFNASASADIKNHAIQFGLLYEQNTSRSYSYNAYGLWYLMRQITDKHIIQLDKTNPHPIYDSYGVFQDTIWYDRLYSKDEQAFFDYNLRQKMGLPTDGTDWIDIDSYDINTHTIRYYDKDTKSHTVTLSSPLSIDMFNADELLNSGNSYVGYSGYDYKGNKLKNKPSFDDFFTAKDEYGNYKREIGAFEPIYMAGYIQDKFAFNDLIFNIGLRIDRFDLNQKVLKDPFLLYDAKTVADVKNENNSWAVIPTSMGDNNVVYVDNVKNPTKILGFRNQDKWYNAEGTEISDPSILETPSGIAPYLVDPEQKQINSKSFKDYQPQMTYMPRVSFSFPISDEALFFAHYDVLTKRPTDYEQLSPLSYLYIEKAGSAVISNPDLKPERTVDYELGFQQKISNTSSLKLSVYYKETRDLIQSYSFFEAYPKTYFSFNNLDFGTVKGLTLTYDLRQTGNIWVKASYTLQFADGTGSSASSAYSLIASGQPNLRTIYPLSYDKRHDFKISLDYRYFGGKEYNGPKITYNVKGTDKVKTILLLENTGMNISFHGGSGIPYTSRNIIGGSIKGSLNGSRLPWQFSMDARIDRDITVKWKGFNKKTRSSNLNLYFVIYNVLNTKNIMNVYATTGNPDDDGYLTAAENQSAIRAQTDERAYRELYALAFNNPDNYMLPRRVRFGLTFSY